MSRTIAASESRSVSKLLCRAMCAGFSSWIPAGFRVAYWHELGTASRANLPGSSRPRVAPAGKEGGTLPRGWGGRADTHGVSHALDTLFFVEQIANYLGETKVSVQRARSKFSELKKSTVDQNLGDRPASGVLGDCHFFQI